MLHYKRKGLVLFVLYMLLTPHTVFASYIDPGAGSYFVQLIIAVALGGLFAIKVFWGKLTVVIKKIFKLK